MFVAINNTDMNINDVEKWIKTARDANGGVISPEDAMEVLSKTNHLGHIKKVLRNIYKNCTTPEKMAPYREFILSCVDEREMSADALKMLQEMATLCGCEDEFKVANGKLKIYGKFDCDNVVIVKSKEEFEALEGENLTVYFDADEVDLLWRDLSKVKALKFREGAEVNLGRAENLPRYLDLSMCSKVDLHSCDLRGVNIKFREGAEVDLGDCKNLPKDLDLSMCSKVDLSYCDLEGLSLKFREGAVVGLIRPQYLPKDLDVSMCSYVNFDQCDLEGLNLKFREGAVVNLSSAKKLPKDLDLSMCSRVNLSFCDLEGLNLKFREGAVVNLERAKNLPKDLDVSMCSEVDLRYCVLGKIKKLKFREGAEVNLDDAKNLPKDLDVSMCSLVSLWRCDLKGLNLKFREGAVVDLMSAKKLPEVLDFSMCSKVNLAGCDLSGVERVTFKDKAQEKEFMKGANNFDGKVVYASDEQNIPAMVNSGMEM